MFLTEVKRLKWREITISKIYKETLIDPCGSGIFSQVEVQTTNAEALANSINYKFPKVVTSEKSTMYNREQVCLEDKKPNFKDMVLSP